MRVQIPRFENARVLVIGDLMLDRYWHGGTSRISPEAPVPVVHVKEEEQRPGGAGNVALNIAALGAQVTLLGLTGEDEQADALQAQLEAAGVECQFERIAGHATITKLRVLSRHQQLIRLDFEDDFKGLNGDRLLERFSNALESCDVALLSDYGKGTLDNSLTLIETARAAGKPVLVDPKGSDFTIYRGATLITPNFSEFEEVAGRSPDDESVVTNGEALRKRIDLEALLVTRGEHGMSLLRADEAPLHLPTVAREVFDVTGAGDTVISLLAASLAAGHPMPDATSLANTGAGLIVGKLGAATITVPELRRALHMLHASGHGVVTEAQLLELVEDARAHNETVVMTNGCFDILHPGHVDYLEQARNLGDHLIVAVNDDASVSRLKGENRPINNLDHRMAVLAALESVDWVVPFGEETPERLICNVLPDLLVKGGDYTADEVAGGTCVRNNGGEVTILTFKDGHSTTTIIDTIRSGE